AEEDHEGNSLESTTHRLLQGGTGVAPRAPIVPVRSADNSNSLKGLATCSAAGITRVARPLCDRARQRGHDGSLPVPNLKSSHPRPRPHSSQTRRATRATSPNFRSCSSKGMLLPLATDAKPHWVESVRRSNGTNLAASWIRAISSSSVSSRGRL